MATTATLTTGAEYVYSDSADQTSGARKRICQDLIYSQDPKDLPMRDYFGGYGKLTVESTSFDHIEDRRPPILGTIGATGSSGSAGGSTWNLATTVASLPVTDGDVFRIGDVVLTEQGELLVLAAVSESGNTIQPYARGDLGSTESVVNVDGDDLYIVGNAQLEGYTYGVDVRFYTRPSKTQFTQIFDDSISISKSYEAVPKFGIKSEVAHQLDMKLIRQAILFERACLYSNPNYGTTDGSASQPRTMGGIIGKGSTAANINIQTNTTDLSSATLTEDHINTEMQEIFDAGGSSDTIMVNSFNKKTISDFLMPYRRTGMDDKKYTGIVSAYENDFGMVNVLLNRYMLQSDVVILAKKNFSMGALRPFDVIDLPDNASKHMKTIEGELSCLLVNEEHAAYIYGTATS
jgi:hypothetical protein